MRIWLLCRALPGRTVVAAGLLAAVLSAMPVRAQAQGLFDLLFGTGQKKSVPRPGYRAAAQPHGGTYNLNRRRYQRYALPSHSYGAWLRNHRSKQPLDGPGKGWPPQRTGGYRTVCVRPCDGYYFPINFAVGRGHFSRDAKTCRSKCGDEAKLYYMPTRGTPGALRDLRGEFYAKTKTAFLYRKKRVKGCACRPSPWSQSEIYRHKLYELNEPEERRLARIEGDVDFLAGISKKRKAVILAEAKAKARAEAEARVTSTSAAAKAAAGNASVRNHEQEVSHATGAAGRDQAPKDAAEINAQAKETTQGKVVTASEIKVEVIHRKAGDTAAPLNVAVRAKRKGYRRRHARQGTRYRGTRYRGTRYWGAGYRRARYRGAKYRGARYRPLSPATRGRSGRRIRPINHLRRRPAKSPLELSFWGFLSKPK